MSFQSSFTDKVDEKEAGRYFADPVHQNQRFCLHSFVPAQGATPNEKGLFGVLKIRGCFDRMEEAHARAQYLIRNHDSYHNILTGYVGRWAPVALDNAKYIEETEEVDLRKQTRDVVKEDVKQKRRDEQREIEEMKEREQRLLEENEEGYEEEPIEVYIRTHMKKATLLFTYLETAKKMKQMRRSVRQAYADLARMDAEHPDLRDQYMDHYAQKRKEHNIPDNVGPSAIDFLDKDAEVDFDVRADPDSE